MPLIRREAIEKVFNDDCIEELAVLARLQPGSDLVQFKKNVHWAVFCYLAQAHRPTLNTLHREAVALHRAAERRDCDTLASLVERMSPLLRQMIEARDSVIAGATASRENLRAQEAPTMPDPAALRDSSTCQDAADALRRLLMTGNCVDKRERPSGRPTVRLVPRLYAPLPSRAEPRRKAERVLTMLLQSAIYQTGMKVSLTARMSDASRKVGPFARMLAKILRLCGTCVAGAEGRAVRLINDVHAARRTER